MLFVLAMLAAIALILSATSSPQNRQIIKPSQPAAAATPVTDQFADVHLLAHAAVVIDMTTGKTLYGLNPDTQLPLASLTKIAMALAVSEVLAPDDSITIPYDTAPTGSAERLAKGSVWSVQDVIDFTLIASSNKGAEILAAAANTKLHTKYPESPTDGTTLWRMNQLVKQLGLQQTYYLNVSGLDESGTQSGAYGSARDMAKLFAYAATSNPSLFAGTRHDGLSFETIDGKKTSAFNTNESQGDITGLVMGKTGYTDLAGGNLGIVFNVGLGHPVVVVVLGSTREGRFSDMQTLIEAAKKTITGE